MAFAQKMCRNCECSGHDMIAAGHDLSKNQCRPGSAIHGEYGSVSLYGGLGVVQKPVLAAGVKPRQPTPAEN